MPPINFCDQTDEARSMNVSAYKTVNMFVDVDITNKRPVLYGCPGLRLFVTLSGQPCRGLKVVSKDETKLYALMGPDFYRVFLNGTPELIGSINSTQGLVSMVDNGLQILIVDGSTLGYIYTISTNTLAQISTTVFPGGVTALFLDGFFVTNDPGTNQMRSSGVYDGSAWAALDVSTAEGDPDNIVAVLADYHQISVFGRISTEKWFNNANLNFPFSRVEGSVLPYGLSAVHSLVSLGESTFMLARTAKGERVIGKITGSIPIPISTPAIDSIIGDMQNIEDAEAIGYMLLGHPFYEITFPSGDRTFVYDDKTGKWHERTTIDADNISHRHAARCHAFFGGNHIVGDYRNGNLYQLRIDEYTDNGKFIQRIRRAMISGEQTAFIDTLSIEMETGVGVVGSSNFGTDPTSPGTAADDAAIGTVAWTNPDNAKTHSETYAVVEVSTYADIPYNTGALSPGTMAEETGGLFGTFSWVNIDNTKVSDDVYATATYTTAWFPYYYYLNTGRIIKNGTIKATNVTDNHYVYSVEQYHSIGSSSNLWGETWTPADINSSDFGVLLFYYISGTSPYALKATNFGFAIPTGATITGIVVEMEDKGNDDFTNRILYVDHIRMTVYYTMSEANTAIKDTSVKIVKSDGSLGATNKATNVALPAIADYRNYGSGIDLWSESWTAADINDADFGIAISYTGDLVSHYLKVTNFGFALPDAAIINGIQAEVEGFKTDTLGNAYVDHVRMTISYSLPAEVGVDPVMSLKVSRDAGHTWGNEKIAKIGAIGKYNTRVKFRQLGRSRKGMVIETLISDPIKIAITGATVNED